MRRGVLGAAVAMVLALGAAAASWAPAAATPTATAATPHEPTTPLHHVVVMVQEGHSFDNYLGTRRGAAGVPSDVCLPASTGQSAPCVPPHPVTGSPRAILRATADAQRTSVDGGRMDGFVRAQAVHGSSGRAAMGYYPPDQLPVLNGLADRGTIFDRWFAAVPDGSLANDVFAVAARSPGDVTQVPSGGWQDMPLIFDRLQAAGVSWRVYVENYDPHVTIRAGATRHQRTWGQVARVPLLAIPRLLDGPARGHVAPLERYYEDLARGRLPQVSWIVSTAHTERPPQGPAGGQQLVRGVANALLASRAWASAAFLVTYSTSGGWYDHVQPPRAADGTSYGLRVPTVLISPYARAGAVDHTTFDSAAVLKLIEQNWTLAPLTRRDAGAARLLDAFSFGTAAPRPALVDVAPTRAPVRQPSRVVLYAGYLLALLVCLACLAAVARWTRPGRPQEATR